MATQTQSQPKTQAFPHPVKGKREANKVLNHIERAEGKYVLQSFPLVAKLEVTTRCNLRCTMCSVSYREKGNNGSHLDFETFLRLKPLFPYLISTYLYGIGEPLMHPRIMDMFTLLSGAGVNVGFISNGILITEEKMRAWLDGGLYKLSVSMDGATKDVYEAIRRWGNFDRLIENLSMVHQLKKEKGSRFPVLTLNFVVMKDNIRDLPKLLELAYRFEAEEVIITELIPFIDGMKDQVLSYDDPLLHKVYSQAEALADEFNVRLVLPNSYKRWRDQNKQFLSKLKGQKQIQKKVIQSSVNYSFEQVERKLAEIPFASCTEPWSGFWLSQKGFVDPCCYWFKSMGDMKKNSFREIWNNENYQNLRRTVNHPEKRHAQCRKCPVPA